jgi:hypothetical protein
MTNTIISDDVFLLGMGAFVFAVLFTVIRRVYRHMRSLQLAQRLAEEVAAYQRQRQVERALNSAPALNQVAADTQAAPRTASANP